MKKQEAAKKVYEMLSFQYKPIEKQLKSEVSDKTWKIYTGMSYAKRLAVLDSLAARI